mmetsp:Transcript_53331/g.142725  ORF Transcript_53331/g.142725 Transcript_53331/m.142725 type:complete len:117 (-) Transcript_53331:82-432(-)
MTFALVVPPAKWSKEIPRARQFSVDTSVGRLSVYSPRGPLAVSISTIRAGLRYKTVSQIQFVRWFNETLLPHDLRARVASSHVLKPTMLQGHLSPAFSRVVCMFKASLHRLDGFPL